jgi:hypothetical protein
MGLVERLEAEYLPRLRSLEAELHARHPNLRFFTASSATGSLTSYHGHTIYLECFFPDRKHDEPDNVALMIDVCHLDRLPRIMMDVCWDPGPVEDSFHENWTSTDQWPEADDQTLERMTSAFPRLVQAFARAVQRGTPPP